MPSLAATVGFAHRHSYYYQIPDSPRGVVLMIHGCVHSGYNWWPQSESCPECRGLPEELSHTVQALRRGYAGGLEGRGRVPQVTRHGDCGATASRPASGQGSWRRKVCSAA